LISVAGTSTVPGDFSSNGYVDAGDYVVWRKGLGASYSPEQYDTWRQNFGASSGGAGAAHAAVPEPASLLSCLVLLGFVLIRPSRDA
jgi:hypothetical protein